jgi:hypothetical protein
MMADDDGYVAIGSNERTRKSESSDCEGSRVSLVLYYYLLIVEFSSLIRELGKANRAIVKGQGSLSHCMIIIC